MKLLLKILMVGVGLGLLVFAIKKSQPSGLSASEQRFFQQAECKPYGVVQGPVDRADLKVSGHGRHFVYDCKGSTMVLRNPYLEKSIKHFLEAAHCVPKTVNVEDEVLFADKQILRYVYSCVTGDIDISRVELESDR